MFRIPYATVTPSLRPFRQSVSFLVALGIFALSVSAVFDVQPAQAAFERLVTCGNTIAIDTVGEICYTGECTICDVQILAMQILKFLVAFVVLMAAVLFVNAGVLYITSPSNPANISRAHKIFTSTLVGLIIVLAAYLLIDTVMRSLYAEPGNSGPWSTFLCKNLEEKRYCVPKMELVTLQGGAAPKPGGTIGSPGGGGGGSGTGSGVQCAAGNSACSVDSLTNLGYTSTQANVMSCIAMTESSGIARTPPYNIAHPGSNSSACGTFQVTRTTWNAYSSAAGGACQDFGKCMQADCNAKVALALVQNNGYSDWTCAGCNTKAQGCIDKYSN